MRHTETGVRRATDGDAAAMSTLLAGTLMTGRLSVWLVPDPADRPNLMRQYAEYVVAQGLAHGTIDTTDDHTAAAIWHPRSTPPPAVRQRDLEPILGPHTARFALLHAYADTVHPFTAHHYLAHLAVAPGLHQAAVGRALLASHHRLLDAAQLPAYAEVSTSRPRDGLLAACGYQPRSPILLRQGGPVVWRMWRPPTHPDQAEAPGTGLPQRVRVHRTATPFRGTLLRAAPPGPP